MESIFNRFQRKSPLVIITLMVSRKIIINKSNYIELFQAFNNL